MAPPFGFSHNILKNRVCFFSPAGINKHVVYYSTVRLRWFVHVSRQISADSLTVRQRQIHEEDKAQDISSLNAVRNCASRRANVEKPFHICRIAYIFLKRFLRYIYCVLIK
jgi:hypothetical protein